MLGGRDSFLPGIKTLFLSLLLFVKYQIIQQIKVGLFRCKFTSTSIQSPWSSQNLLKIALLFLNRSWIQAKKQKKKQTDLASCVKAIPQCQLQKCHVEMCCDKEIQLKGCPETQAATLVWKKKLCPAIKWFIITTVAWIWYDRYP